MESNLTLLYLTGLAISLTFTIVISINQKRNKRKKVKLERDFNTSKLKLVNELLKSKEEHLNNISHELHDNITVKLLAIKLLLRNKESAFYENCPKQIIELNDYLKKELIGIIDEVRKLSHEYQPYIYNIDDLKNSLNTFIYTINSTQKIKFNYLFNNKTLEEASSFSFTEIYRISTELVKNILNHSNATQAKLELHFLETSIQILVEDNGIGMNENKNTFGNGIKNIIARINLLNGTINFHHNSTFRSGTSVFIEIPNESIKLAR